MSLLIVGLDSTIVNVALPAIHRSFHSSLSELQWTIDAYTLVIASLLMLSGSTADRVGRRRVFQLGLCLFSLGSLLCALAPSLDALIAARVLQAIGGSMLNPVAMSIIRNVFNDPRERAQAIGVWGAMMGVSMALGPVIGGTLVDSLSWRWVFLVNLPVGLAAIVLTALFVPESRAPRARRSDPVGQVLVIVALATLTYAIIEGPRNGWLSAETLILFAVSVVAFISLVVWELRRDQPLIEIRFFRSAPFSGASAIAVCAFAGLGGFLLLNTLYLQEVRGLSPLTPASTRCRWRARSWSSGPCLDVWSALAGPACRWWPARWRSSAGALILTQLTTTTSFALLFVSYALFGFGFGMINPPITNTAVSGMPPSQAGVAAAVASTSRQVGVTLGVAVLGALAGGAATGALGPGFAAATHVSWWITVALGLVILVLALVTTTAWAHRTAKRTAERFREDPETGIAERSPAPAHDDRAELAPS